MIRSLTTHASALACRAPEIPQGRERTHGQAGPAVDNLDSAESRDYRTVSLAQGRPASSTQLSFYVVSFFLCSMR